LTVTDPALTDPTPEIPAQPNASTSLQVSSSKQGEVTILALDGELDGRTAAELETHAAPRGVGAGRDVVLDLHRLFFLDQAGLTALENFAAGHARAGRCLALAAIRPRIRAFLRYVDAQALAPIYTTVEEAADHLALARAAGA
jgi:anti-anti-sigma factor